MKRILIILITLCLPAQAIASSCDVEAFKRSNEEAFLLSDVVFRASEIVMENGLQKARVDKIYKNQNEALKENNFIRINQNVNLEYFQKGAYILGFVRENQDSVFVDFICFKVQIEPEIYRTLTIKSEKPVYVIAGTLKKAEHSLYYGRQENVRVQTKLSITKLENLNSADNFGDSIDIHLLGDCGQSYEIGTDYILKIYKGAHRYKNEQGEKVVEHILRADCHAGGPELYKPAEYYESLVKKYEQKK